MEPVAYPVDDPIELSWHPLLRHTGGRFLPPSTSGCVTILYHAGRCNASHFLREFGVLAGLEPGLLPPPAPLPSVSPVCSNCYYEPRPAARTGAFDSMCEHEHPRAGASALQPQLFGFF